MEQRRTARVFRRRRARSLAARARPRAGRHRRGWPARRPRRRARRGQARRARPRPARRPTARAPAPGARGPPRGRRPPPPGGPLRPTRRVPRPWRPAAAQCGASSAGAAPSTARELLGEPRVQLLALPGEDRRVDRLGQQRVAEPEAACRRSATSTPCSTAWRSDSRTSRSGSPAIARSSGYRDFAPGRRGQPQHALRRLVQAGDALQQESRRPAGAPRRSPRGGEELLGEEGVALRAGDDRVRQRRRQRSLGASREQRRQLLALERAELEHERRAGAPDPVGKPAHALGRRGLIRAVGREQQNRPVVEVVREEDDEIERRGIGPVQILEHEQHRCGSCAVGEQRQRLLEHPQLRASAARRQPGLPERAQGLDERLVRQLRADEIDRAAERAPRTPRRGLACASSDASRVLPMPASPAIRTVAPLPARVASSARSSSPSSRTRPTNTSLARDSIRQYRAAPRPAGRP